MPDAEKTTPMMQQYFEVRRGLPRDTLLLFRLGDFFELFFDDAVAASRLLGLTLTKRQETPMNGSTNWSSPAAPDAGVDTSISPPGSQSGA